MTKNRLYYGDNLDVLRRYVPGESVDLVYLDPPFNRTLTAMSYSPRRRVNRGTDIPNL